MLNHVLFTTTPKEHPAQNAPVPAALAQAGQAGQTGMKAHKGKINFVLLRDSLCTSW
jgi:hypothetical protein